MANDKDKHPWGDTPSWESYEGTCTTCWHCTAVTVFTIHQLWATCAKPAFWMANATLQSLGMCKEQHESVKELCTGPKVCKFFVSILGTAFVCVLYKTYLPATIDLRVWVQQDNDPDSYHPKQSTDTKHSSPHLCSFRECLLMTWIFENMNHSLHA